VDKKQTEYSNLDIWGYEEREDGTNTCLPLSNARLSHVYGGYITHEDGKDVIHGATIVLYSYLFPNTDRYTIFYRSVNPRTPQTYLEDQEGNCQMIGEKLHCTLNPLIFSTRYLDFEIKLKDSTCPGLNINVPEEQWLAMFNALK